MKRIFSLIILSALLATQSFAQEKQKIQEVGVVFQNLDAFGFTYRFGNTNAVWRLTALSLNGGITEYDYNNSTTTSPISSSNFGVGLSFGREKRMNIVENLDLRFGGLAKASFTTGYNKSESPHTMMTAQSLPQN